MDSAVWTALGAIGGSVVTAGGAILLEVVKRRRAPRAPLLSLSSGPHDSTALRVLVADDSPDMRMVARHVLAELGLVVDVAPTLASARELYQAQTYALVIVDLSMPDGDGAAFLQSLPPRTMIYSGASQERIDAARRLGVADVVLPKDGNVPAFERSVQALLHLPEDSLTMTRPM